MSQTQTIIAHSGPNNVSIAIRPAPLPHASRIKWYDPVRRFGFIQPHDKGGDIWFNWLTLLRNKIVEADAEPDRPVTFSYSDPDTPTKQRSVVRMVLGASYK